MWNVMLDPLPEEWNGYPIDSDFRTGIQISQCLIDKELNERERQMTAVSLLFPDKKKRPGIEESLEALEWFLNEFNHDHHGKSDGRKLMDFDIDQWRIYTAFLSQYRIDLNTVDMHWFTFMGLLSNLSECSFTSVIDIRQKKLNTKMLKEEKKAYSDAKRIYDLKEEVPVSEVEKELEEKALEEFHKMLGDRA